MERIQNLLESTKLNWNVRTETTQTESGIILPNIALVREDTNEILGVHSTNYVPYQNEQLMELLDRVSNYTGLDIHRGGMFGGGKKVFIQLKSNDLRLGNDRIEGFVTGVNSFDGTTSLAFGNSNLTISCQNTFFAAYKNLEKVRHTKNMVHRVDEICRGIDGIVQEEQQMFDTIKKMSETRFSQETKDRVIKSLFDIDMDIQLVNYHNENGLSTNVKNKLSRMYIDMGGELQEKGDNVWGLFSGVTKYTTHSLSKDDNTENKMFGAYGNRERKIFKELSVLV
jgi:hypothetical protein